MTIETSKKQIRIAVSVQSQPDGSYLLENDMGQEPVEVKSIDDVLEIANVWAKIRKTQKDAIGAEIVVDLSYPALTFH